MYLNLNTTMHRIIISQWLQTFGKQNSCVTFNMVGLKQQKNDTSVEKGYDSISLTK